MKKLFPLSYKVIPEKLVSLLAVIAIYAVIGVATRFLFGLIPMFKIAFRFIASLIEYYCLIGATVSALVYVKRF